MPTILLQQKSFARGSPSRERCGCKPVNENELARMQKLYHLVASYGFTWLKLRSQWQSLESQKEAKIIYQQINR